MEYQNTQDEQPLVQAFPYEGGIEIIDIDDLIRKGSLEGIMIAAQEE